MANIFHPDFQDFIRALNKFEVDYILLGGYAVILHGYNRTTGDMDIWVRKTKINYDKLVPAFEAFGMPVFDMTEDNFINNSDIDVFTFGISPVSIDLMTEAKGLDFEEAFQKATLHQLEEGLTVRVIHINHLLQTKAAAGRLKDMDDIEHLKGK